MQFAKPKVLYITYDGLTDPLGQSQIIPYLKGLSNEYDITILSCEKSDKFQSNGTFIKKLLDDNSLSWEFVLYTKKPPVLSTLKDLWKMSKAAQKLHRTHHFKIVHCRTVISWLIGKKLQSNSTKVLFDMRGFWADERVDGKLWNLENPLFSRIYHFFKREQNKAYHQADALVSLTNAGKEHIVSSESISTEKISVIPCNADQIHFQPKEKYISHLKSLQKEVGLSGNERIVGYAGSLGTRYMLNEMLDCFSIIQQQHSNAIFLIITLSPLFELKELIQKKGLNSSVIIIGSSYKKIPEYLSLVDVALYFIYAGNSGKAVSPTKQAEFLSMGIPIITNAGIGDSKSIIAENEVGYVLEDFNSKGYQQVADNLDDLLKKPSSEIVKIASRFFQLESGVETYRSIYKKLV